MSETFLSTDGSDFHDAPVRDCREDCSICGYTGGPLRPHRKHPAGGWEYLSWDEKTRIYRPAPKDIGTDKALDLIADVRPRRP